MSAWAFAAGFATAGVLALCGTLLSLSWRVSAIERHLDSLARAAGEGDT